jgi:spore germination cell wall hydrolase CwlJ-like protein
MLTSALFCMATAVYFEARDQDIEGQLAVAQVIVNRAYSAVYPNRICDVVKGGGERLHECQFSFYCDGRSDRPTDPDAYRVALSVAVVTLSGIVPDVTDGATHYHADYVRPWWSQQLERVKQIGNHIFYKNNKG